MTQENGLIFSYILKDGAGESLNWAKVKQWHSQQGPLWLHLDYSQATAKKWLWEESGLDPVVCEALIAQETRPRLMTYPQAVFLILRGVNCNSDSDPEDMVALRMWIEKDRIITMRQRKVMAVNDIHELIQKNNGPLSINEFIVLIARRLTDRIGTVITDIDDTVDELEDRMLTDSSYSIRTELSQMRRRTISLRRYIAPQRDVLNRLQIENISWLTDRDRIHLREIAERTSRYVEDIDAIRDRAAITQEELNNRLSEQMNKTMYILSVITGIFLPLGLLTGLLGINVGGIPGADNKNGFIIVAVAMIVIAVIQFFIFKRRKIL